MRGVLQAMLGWVVLGWVALGWVELIRWGTQSEFRDRGGFSR